MRSCLSWVAVLLWVPFMALAAPAGDASLVQKATGESGRNAAVETVCPSPEQRWMSSTEYLPSVAECLHGAEAASPDARRIALVRDIHLKATAYNWLNKLTFWVAIGLALTVLVWPSYVAIKAGKAENARKKAEAEDMEVEATHWSQRSATTAAIQTTVAALAALSFAFYAHYKGNQVVAENLMREIIFADSLDADRVAEILSAIADMDKGFGFTTVEALRGK